MPKCRHCRRTVRQTVQRSGFCRRCIEEQRVEDKAMTLLAGEMGVAVNAETRPVLRELVREGGER